MRFAGVWCNGSTEASDSSGVSSILTTPATKKLVLRYEKRVFFIFTNYPGIVSKYRNSILICSVCYN